jgi:spermidine synthase
VPSESQAPAVATGLSADRGVLRLLPALFALGGCAALIYQVVWFEQLGLTLGTSAISLGLLLATFMGGMCIGSLWLPRIVRAGVPALTVYAALELGIGVLGIAALIVIPVAGNAYTAWAGGGLAGLLVRAVAAAVCLLPATVLMGATLPAAAGALTRERDGSEWLGFCYAANIGGGVLGSLGAAFYLLRVHDVYVATAVAAALNFVGAAVAWYAAARVRAPQRAAAEVEPEPAAGPRWQFYLATGASGFTALSSEVLWTRHLSLLLGATVYAFALILAVFLLGLGIGSAAAAALGRRLPPRRTLAGCQLLLAAALAWAGYTIARSLPFWPLDVTLPTTAAAMLQLDWLRTAWAVLPAASLWGASFPLALAACAADGAISRRTVGRLYATNTSGAIAGALLTALVLIDTVGSQRVEQSSIVVAGGIGLLLLLGAGGRGRVSTVVVGVAAAAMVAGLVYSLPAVPPELIAYGRFLPTRGIDANVIYSGEGLSGSIAVTREPTGILTYHNAGKTQASTYPQDLRLQKMLGHLATLVADDPKNVLVIGLGAGITAGAVSIDPAVERVVVAEIEPLVPQAAERFFSAYNQGVVTSPKAEIRIDDGRHYLATTQRKFDAITSDPLDPWVKGAAALYTREFWQLAKAHLTSGGVVTAFVQLYETNEDAVRSEIATFFDVFPNGALFANRVEGMGYDAVLLGRADDGAIDVERVARRLGSAAYGPVADSLAQSGFASALDLLGTYVGDATAMSAWLGDAARNTDRNLRLQYLAGASLNSYRAGDILTGLVAAPAPLPARLFVGTAARLEELRQRVRASRGDD